MLDRLLGVDEQALAYDLSRAHSADVFFLKLRAYTWGIILTISFFLIGNIMGALGVDVIGYGIDSLKGVIGWD